MEAVAEGLPVEISQSQAVQDKVSFWTTLIVQAVILLPAPDSSAEIYSKTSLLIQIGRVFISMEYQVRLIPKIFSKILPEITKHT